MHSPTLLNVPAIESENGAFSRLTQEQLVQWLRELPRGNPDACAEILLDGIRGMNRSPLRRLSRFQLAEALRPVVNDIAETLVKRYRAASLPLPEDASAQAETVSRLYQELTVGFRHAVNEQMKARRLRRTEAQLAIQRALLTQGRALLEAYRIYMPEPPGFWQTLHTLYANAEALKLQALPIEGTRDSDETALSVKQAYLRSVILSLANPYHLMQDEAEELYRRIGRWVHFARLSRPSLEAPLGGSFVLDLASDFPPRYVAQQHGTSVPMKDARVLELGQLVSTLDQQIAQLDENIRHGRHTSTLSQRLQRSMYQRFQDALGGRQERTSERRPTMARIRLVDGLARCHFMLNGQQPFNPRTMNGAGAAKSPTHPGAAPAWNWPKTKTCDRTAPSGRGQRNSTLSTPKPTISGPRPTGLMRVARITQPKPAPRWSAQPSVARIRARAAWPFFIHGVARSAPGWAIWSPMANRIPTTARTTGAWPQCAGCAPAANRDWRWAWSSWRTAATLPPARPSAVPAPAPHTCAR